MKRRGRFLVSGRVQGVCFRATARDEAMRLDLTGWVRNLPNGDVECVAEGDSVSLARLAAWMRQGPPYAVVRRYSEQYDRATGEFNSFDIMY